MKLNPLDLLDKAIDLASELLPDGDKKNQLLVSLAAARVEANNRWGPQGIVAVVAGVVTTVVLAGPTLGPLFGVFIPFTPESTYLLMGFALFVLGVPMAEFWPFLKKQLEDRKETKK